MDLMHVLTGYESAGIKNCGILSDSGENDQCTSVHSNSSVAKKELAIIFNETFLLMRNAITKENIDSFETSMTSTLAYFESWRAKQLELKKYRQRLGTQVYFSDNISSFATGYCWFLSACLDCLG